MSVAHEAGVLHGAPARAQPAWLARPTDADALVPALWSANTRKDPDGVLAVAGLRATEIAAEFGTPAYVVDEDDFRGRIRAFVDAFTTAFAPAAGLGGVRVHYAGKAFLCRAVARWVQGEGAALEVCTGGELAVALAAGFPPAAMALHGNNKLPTEIDRAVAAGIGRVVVDATEEIGRLAAAAAAHGREVAVLVRVTVGVEAHTHSYIATANEDQKFGFSLADGSAERAVEAILATPGLRLAGLHSHIGSQIFDAAGFAVSAQRLVGLYAHLRRRHPGRLDPGPGPGDDTGPDTAGPGPRFELGLGGGFGVAYTTADDPWTPGHLATALAEVVRTECTAHGVPVPLVTVEPGRAIAAPSTCTLYTVGTVKDVALDGGSVRRYVAVDGGMSDNIRPALYGAAYSATRAGRTSPAAADPVLARVVGRHCESGDVVVWDEFLPADLAAGDLLAVPGTGAYCRSMASQYNHVPRPPVLAVRDGRARVLVRRETEDDLLALDVG